MFAIIAGFPENLFVCFGAFSRQPVSPVWPASAEWQQNPVAARPSGSIRNQIMKRTYQASKVRRARTHGFLVRMKTRGGRAVINARRAKGRKRLAV
jgi:large subunit ribosomal protein L34